MSSLKDLLGCSSWKEEKVIIPPKKTWDRKILPPVGARVATPQDSSCFVLPPRPETSTTEQKEGEGEVVSEPEPVVPEPVVPEPIVIPSVEPKEVKAKQCIIPPPVSELYLKVRFGVITFFCKGINNQQTIVKPSSGFLYQYRKRVYVIGCAHGLLFSDITTPYSEITVGIAGINGNPLDVRVFNALLLGCDATADLTVSVLTNISKDEVDKLTTLQFANSLEEKEGNPCFTIGNPLTADVQSIATGVIRDPNFSGTQGNRLLPQTITDISIFSGNSGSPIFNACGYIVGIMAFEFTQTGDTTSPGYGGGTASQILVPVIHNIINGIRLTKVPIAQQPLYPICQCPAEQYIMSYRKATYGDINWVMMTNPNAVQFYPKNYTNLRLQGLIITRINSPYNCIEKPVAGRPIQPFDIITDVKDPSGRWIPIGSYDDMFAVGFVLWQYDPNEKPIVEHKVIHQPFKNTRKSIVKILFDKNYPRTETPPLSGQLAPGSKSSARR